MTWIMNDATEPRRSSESLSLTMNTGWLDSSLAFFSSGVLGMVNVLGVGT